MSDVNVLKKQDFMDNNGVTYVISVRGCPYCGSDAKVTPVGNTHTKSRKINIKCSNRSCGNKGFTVGAIVHGVDFCLDHAVRKWNERVYNA